MISLPDFQKVEMKIGTITQVQEIEGSQKLWRLSVDLGESKPRQILAGLKKFYSPEQLLQKQVVVVTNLEPKQMLGLVSEGMLLAADTQEQPVLISPLSPVPNGTVIK